MAQQAGLINFTGTLNGLTGYKREGKYFVRSKSSITKERIYNDPAFLGTRQMADRKKITSPITAKCYHLLPKKLKKHGLFGKMSAEADRLFTAGFTQIEILGSLYIKFYPCKPL